VNRAPSPSPVPRADVLLALAVIAAVASIALTGVAFWLSYAHLHAVADAHGLQGDTIRAWAWPATVDLFIVIGEVLILRASLRQTVDPWAIGLTVIGSGGSIALNVAGVGDKAQGMDYVVAAVPPIAALFAFGALMQQLHGALAARTESAPATLPTAVEATPQSAPTPAPVTLPPMPAERPEPVAQSAPEEPLKSALERLALPTESAPKARPRSASKRETKTPRKTPPKRSRSATRADAKAAIEALYDTHKKRPLEGDMTAVLKTLPGYPHTSRQHANKLRAEIERERPDLAALGSDNVLALTGS
jgi:hypothetical protein